MKKTTKMFPLTRTSLVRSLFASTAALLLAGLPSSAEAETYYLLGADPSGASSMDGSGKDPVGWGLVVGGTQEKTSVEVGNIYVLPEETMLGTKYHYGSADVTFGGEQLVFEGGSLNDTLSGKKLTIPNLLVRDEGMTSKIVHGYPAKSLTLAGTNWVVESASTLAFDVSPIDTSSSTFTISPTITGEGTLKFYRDPKNAGTGKSNFTLNGNLSGFSGKLVFSGDSNAVFTVSSQAAFASGSTNDAINIVIDSVDSGVTIKFSNNVTSSNGWDFGSVMPTIDTNGKTITIYGPLAGLAGVNMKGTGKLIFAHPGLVNGPLTFAGAQEISAAELKAYSQEIDAWTAGKTLAVKSGSAEMSGTGLSVTLLRGTAENDSAVSVFWGSDADSEATDWDALTGISVGTIKAGSRTLDCSGLEVPDGALFARFCSAEDGWSDPLALSGISSPVISRFGTRLLIDDTAKTISYSGAFLNYTEGTTVTIHYVKGNVTTWSTAQATVTPDGFSGTITGISVGATDFYTFYFTAELEDSTIDRTEREVFMALGIPAAPTFSSVSGSNIQEIPVTASISSFGLGNTRELAVMANVDGTWLEISKKELTETGSHTITFSGRGFMEFDTACTLKVVTREISDNGRVIWELSSGTKTFTAKDATTVYTWTGAADDGLWNNPENWSSTFSGALGYPWSTATAAEFPAGTVATVLVSRAETARLVDVQNAEHVYIKGVSEDASITIGYFQFGNPTADKNTKDGNYGGSFDLVLDGITVTETESCGYSGATGTGLKSGYKNYHHMGDGASLTLTNGAVFNSKGNWTPYGDNFGANNVSIVIEKGSVFNLDTCLDPNKTDYKTYGFYLGHDQTRLVIDDTQMTVVGNFVLNDIASSQQPDGSDFLVFKGTNPVLRVTETMVVSDASRMPTTIEFHMPSAGYAESPIQIEGNTAPFPLKTAGAAVTPLTLSIIPPDPEDPSSLKFGEAPLVSSAAGFDPNYIKLSPETEKLCQLVFEGENAAGYPTTLRVARRGSTYMIQ